MFNPVTKEELKVPANIESLKALRDFISRVGKKYRFADKVINAFKLAIDEASTNIIRHAYRERTGNITIRAVVRKDSLTISLIDQGRYFDPNQVKDPDLRRYVAIGKKGGLGIFMIRKLVDEIDYRRTEEGNELRLTKNKNVERRKRFVLPRIPGSMRTKYYAISAGIVSTAILVGYLYNFVTVDNKILDESLDRMESISIVLSRNSIEGLIDDDYLRLSKEAKVIVTQNQDFVAIAIITDLSNTIKGTTMPEVFPPLSKFNPGAALKNLRQDIQVVEVAQVASSSTTATASSQYFVVQKGVAAVAAGEQTMVGKVYVFVPTKLIYHDIAQKRLQNLKLAFFILLIANVGLGLLIFLIFTPFQKLSTWVRDMGQEDIRDQIDIDTSNEIGKIAQAFSEITDKFRESQKSLADQERIQQEMHLAKEIQQTLLPAEFPDIRGYELASYYEAAKEVGGDYYDFVEVDRDRMGVVVADVSGKGVPGSLVMTMIRTALRTEARGMDSAAEVLSRVNDFVLGDIKKGMFVTLFYMILDSRKRRVTFASAGHNPMILYRSDTQKTYYLNPKGFPVGISLDENDLFRHSIADDTIQLSKGDIIISHTDGITEAMNSHRELFGEERLLQILRQYGHLHAKQFVEKLKEELVAFTEGQVQNDDITLVVIKENMSSEESEFERARQIYYDMLNGKSMTEACNEHGLPISTFSQKYRENLEKLGVDDFKQEYETTSIEAKHLSIEEQTKIYDIIRKRPEWGPKRISDQLNTEEYGFAQIPENRIYEELVRKRLNTRALREAYVARGTHRKRMKPPGTPMLTLDGKIILDDQLGPKLHAPVEPIFPLPESERSPKAESEEKPVFKRPKSEKPHPKTPIDEREGADLVLSDLVELLDKGDQESIPQQGMTDRDESNSHVPEESEEKASLAQDVEFDQQIQDLLGNLAGGKISEDERKEAEEIDFADFAANEYSQELFDDRTNGDQIPGAAATTDEHTELAEHDKPAAARSELDGSSTLEELTQPESSEKLDQQTDKKEHGKSAQELLAELSIKLGVDTSGDNKEDDLVELMMSDVDLHTEEEIGSDLIQKTEGHTEEVSPIAEVEPDNDAMSTMTENDQSKPVTELFDQLTVQIEDSEAAAISDNSDKNMTDFFDLISGKEVSLQSELLVSEKSAVAEPPTESNNDQKKVEENKKEGYQKKLLVAGGHLYMQRKYDKAINIFQKIITQYPKSIEAYYNLGNSYFRLRKLEEAQKAYEKVCELDPTFLDALENLGVICANKREYTKAIGIWKKIMEFDPNREDIKKNIEKALRMSKR